jgi:hypothetical protein
VLIILNELSMFKETGSHDADKLKSLITDPTLSIRTKFLNTHTSRNLLNFILVSNHLDPIHLE